MLCESTRPKTCKNTAIPCVAPGMGGHAGAFIDIHRGCSINCGKKYVGGSIKEAHFYERMYDLARTGKIPKKFLSFFPKYYGIRCKKDGVSYFEIENLKTRAGNKVKTLDFKVGKKSAFKFNTGFLKNKRLGLINTLSTSSRLGFRLEGSSVSIKTHKSIPKSFKIPTPIKVPGKKYKLYSKNPFHIFDSFFSDEKSLNQTIKSLERMYNKFIVPNQDRKTHGLGFIGASILFVSGSKSSFVKMIDFAHPFVYDPANPSKNTLNVIDNMSNGVKSLLDQLKLFKL